MHMTVSKYLNGTWSMNNLTDKGNFKKQNRCLWTEAGGGASLDSGVKQNWQKSSVIFPPPSVWFTMCVYIWAHAASQNGVEVSLLPSAYPFHPPTTQYIYRKFSHKRFFYWICNVKHFGQCFLHPVWPAVQLSSRVNSEVLDG